MQRLFSALPVVYRKAAWFVLLVGMVAMTGYGATYGDSSQHWSFRPVHDPKVPEVNNQNWVRTAVDAYILAELERNGISPSGDAGRQELIRRVYANLWGIPPSWEEVQAFVQDPRPDAYERLVDRLLASPRYGERWGRHWLDVARYADTKDLVLLYGKDSIRPYAYTYRDYVIRALNEDLSYADFVRDQLAAEQVVGESGNSSWRLAAMGFLTLGRMFDNNPHDIIDDQIDTVTRGFLGLTVSCARCHDHKFDAIPTDDYYALYGVFASSEARFDLPLIENPSEVPGGIEFEKELAAKRLELDQHIDQQYEEINRIARERVADYLVQVGTRPPDPLENSVFFLSLSPDDLRPAFLTTWRRVLERHSENTDPVFGPWNRLMEVKDESFEVEGRRRIEKMKEEASGSKAEGSPYHPRILKMIQEWNPTSREEVAKEYGRVLKEVWEAAGRGVSGQGEADSLVNLMSGVDSPFYFTWNQTFLHMSRVPRDRYGGLVTGLDKFAVHASMRPPSRAMVLRDAERPVEPRIFRRGSPSNPGKIVERRFLSSLSSENSRPFENGSGRLELAEAINTEGRALASRVFMNRVWAHHMGVALVGTLDDFGVRSDVPTHPELLEYLAWLLLKEEGSLKRVHREILLSSTFRQSSLNRQEAFDQDPENRWYWRAHRRRLDWESMRDSLLSVSDRMDWKMGGVPVDVANDPENRRRTVYGLVDRQNLPEVFRAFDFASPDQCNGKRPFTTVAQQALFAMNSSFVQQQAVGVLERIRRDWRREVGGRNQDSGGEPSVEFAVQTAFRLILIRDASPAEAQRVRSFLGENEIWRVEEGVPSQMEQFVQALLMSNEFLFVD